MSSMKYETTNDMLYYFKSLEEFFCYLVFLKVHLHSFGSHCPHDLLLILLDDILHEGYPAH